MRKKILIIIAVIVFIGAVISVYQWYYKVHIEPLRAKNDARMKNLLKQEAEIRASMKDTEAKLKEAGEFVKGLEDYEVFQKHASLGFKYADQKDYLQAIVEFSKALDHKAPKEKLAAVVYLRGVIYYEMEEFEKAVADATEVINIGDNEFVASAYFYRADSQRFLKNYMDSCDDYLMAIALGGDYPEIEYAKERILLLPTDLVEERIEVFKNKNKEVIENKSSFGKGSTELELKTGALEQHRYVVENFYDKIASASGSQRGQLLEKSVKGFQMVLDNFNDPQSITTRQLSAYYLAQCYRELGQKNNYITALELCIGFMPDADPQYESTSSSMQSVYLMAEKELRQIRGGLEDENIPQ